MDYAELPFKVCEICLEGMSDYFFGRPFSRNPYNKESAEQYWKEWNHGWEAAEWIDEYRGHRERLRWGRRPVRQQIRE